MIAQTVSPEKIARASLKLSPFLAGHDSTGNRYQRFRSESDYSASYGPDIVQSHYAGYWNVEVYGRDEDGFWGYTRVAHQVTKKEATAVARDLAIAEYITQHTCPDCQTFVPGPDGCDCGTRTPAPSDPYATLPASGAITGTPAVIADALKPYDPMPEPVDHYIVTMTRTNELSMVTRNGRPLQWSNLGDAIQTGRNLLHGTKWTGYIVHAMPSNTVAAEWHEETTPEPEPPAPTPTPARKQRTRATSQKRDGQRAQRAALNEAYHAAAETHAPELSAILAELGFTVVEQRESGETPVMIWQSDEATIKQTPYTLRVYNGQPKRLPRHGDAELVNSVEAGWVMRTQPTGYAAGIVAAILPLIETPDPYMQALDAIEAREAEQSAPTLNFGPVLRYRDCAESLAFHQQATYRLSAPRPESGPADTNAAIWTIHLDREPIAKGVTFAEGVRIASEHAHNPADDTIAALDAMEAREAEQSAPLPRPSADDLREMYGSVDLDLTARLLQAGEHNAYTIAAPGHDGRPVIIAEVEHHEIPNPVLVGGQPSMSGPWDVPAISGGSQDAEPTAEQIAALKTPTADGNHLAPDDPDYGYCLTGCERPATQWIKQGVNFLAYCDACAPCPHDALTCADCGVSSEETDVQPVSFGDHAPRCWTCADNYKWYMVFYGKRADDLAKPCQHDAERDEQRKQQAPPAIGGGSQDASTKQRYTLRDLEKKCAEASAICGKHFEIVQDPRSKRYAVTYDLPDSMRDNPGEWLRERDCNTIRYWIEHLDASIRRHRACMSATDYGYKLVGDEMTDMFPWAVVALPSGQIIQRYSHRAVADQVADRMRMDRSR